jgi:uncharacterized protein YndB with AHSA1/START domain
MSVQSDASGRRFVEMQLEVAGTPEEVWQAIATGPGISSWLMPAEFEEQDGKPVALKLSFGPGPGMESRSRVTAYDPPLYWAGEADSMVPGSPPIACEWHVEAQAGGTCKLRIVQSLFASTDDWDDQLEYLTSGWSAYLATLRIYLRHFRGQRSTLVKFMTPTAGTEAEVWNRLMSALKLQGASVGQRWSSPAGAPSAGGVAEYLNASPNDALLRLDTPGPAIAAFGTVDMGGPTMVGMNLYLYGDQAAAIADRDWPRWQAWMQEHFPMPAEALSDE